MGAGVHLRRRRVDCCLCPTDNTVGHRQRWHVPTPSGSLTAEQAAERARRRAAFGARVRAIRLERGMTQEQVALRSGLDRPFLIQVEYGRRSMLVERLEDLAGALNVPISALFEDSGAPS